MAKIYKNQRVRLSIPFTSDESGVVTVLDITGCPVECELFAPKVVGVATITISGTIDDGELGLGSVNVPENTFNAIGNWKAQGYVTKDGTRWPAEVSQITITERGSVT